jgi:Asp-tRNA(Asn)/Glu-tRNA(Gln) amidotransferase A subunit family amidase
LPERCSERIDGLAESATGDFQPIQKEDGVPKFRFFKWFVALCATGLTLATEAKSPDCSFAEMDQDLMEVTIPQLHTYYVQRKYTITQVVDWYLNRIARYNGVYHAIEQVFDADARALAAREDAENAGSVTHGPLWGVPIVIKANTSIQGKVTTDGWEGYVVPGHELVAPRDATIVARLRAAGAIILGHTNMPDFANSDTNRSSSFGRTGNAFDVRFSPGGSSGGTVTAVTANLALLGNGTDTGNSIRMPAATSALVGVFPTRGLVSIAGIAPLDWLLDNTGPIARTVSDAAIALEVMAGEDPLDPATRGSTVKAQQGAYLQYLKVGALKGKRLGVPSFILKGIGIPFHGTPAAVSELAATKQSAQAAMALDPRTQAAFMSAVEKLRALGATVVMDDSVLPESFAQIAARISTYAYVREGTDLFLKEFGSAAYHSAADYEKVMGAPLGAPIIGAEPTNAQIGDVRINQRNLESDSDADRSYFGPRRRALEAYLETLDRLHLDGYVYPAIQMPPVDETMPQDGKVSDGPHSATSWVNMLGVPAVVVVGGFYESGLPFGLELSGRPFKDGDLLALAYAWEQATHYRHPPVLVERGLLPNAR